MGRSYGGKARRKGMADGNGNRVVGRMGVVVVVVVVAVDGDGNASSGYPRVAATIDHVH
jgi:hypothetical protein